MMIHIYEIFNKCQKVIQSLPSLRRDGCSRLMVYISIGNVGV